MSPIWLIWCAREAYAPMRREIRARGDAVRFVRLSELSDVAEVVDGFAGEELCAAVQVGATDASVEHAETLLGAVARTGRMLEIIACVGEVEAGVAARCFHAGATDVIAVGDPSLPEPDCDGLRIENRSERTGLECEAEREAGRYRDDDMGASSPWDEIPPWEMERPGGDAPHGGREVPDDVGVRGAPVVTVISGRGGVGKTTIVAAMAACAARAGLRAAVLDLDLMFGNLPEVFGVESPRGIEGLGMRAQMDGLAEHDVEATAMRVGPGLTLWGPCAAPEQAEFCAPSVEGLVRVLRDVADVIFIDTSGFWGDAVAMAVASCDRCLVVGSTGGSSVSSGRRAVDLAARLGVPRTRMTCVFNRMGARGGGEDQALAFEMGTALRSRARIADGGDEVAGMLSFGQVASLIAGSGHFACSMRRFTGSLLQELGCPIAQWVLDEERRRAADEGRPRFALPWRRRAGDAL